MEREGREGDDHQGERDPCPHTSRQGKVRKGVFCLRPRTLNLNESPFAPMRPLARKTWDVGEGTYIYGTPPMSDHFINHPTESYQTVR